LSSVGMGLRPAKAHEKLSGHTAGQSWRTHSCVPRRHSGRRPLPTVEASSETRRCRHECLRHEGFFAPVTLTHCTTLGL
jgi:hypothetical protein